MGGIWLRCDRSSTFGIRHKGLALCATRYPVYRHRCPLGVSANFTKSAWRLVQALATLCSPEGHIRIPGFYDAVLTPSEAQLAAITDQPDQDEELREAYKVERFVDDLSGADLRER